MRKLSIIILSIFLTSSLFAASRGVGDGAVLVGMDVAGYGYSWASHNDDFPASGHYMLAFKGEYVAFTFGGMALGFQPFFGFAIGDITFNPTFMLNPVFHFMRKGVFDPYFKFGFGLSRITQDTEDFGIGQSKALADKDYTLSTGFFHMNAGLGTNIWVIPRLALSLDFNFAFIERNLMSLNFGVLYKLPMKKM
jgi:hypothetical protein